MHKTPMQKIVDVRKYRNYSQSQIAELLNIAKASWSRKERGTIKGFSFDDIEIIINFLKVDARWVFNQTNCSLEDALLENIPFEMIHYKPNDIYSMTPESIILQQEELERRLDKIETDKDELGKELRTFYKDLKEGVTLEETNGHKYIIQSPKDKKNNR